jgi:hypothetical protein
MREFAFMFLFLDPIRTKFQCNPLEVVSAAKRRGEGSQMCNVWNCVAIRLSR